MPTIKDYNQKLKSLKNTQKITSTMKMVSASKLRKAQQAQVGAKHYAQNIARLVSRIAVSVDTASHPLLTPHESVKKALVLVFTSDKGLCGAFNNNANKRVSTWMNENKDRYDHIDLSFCGKRGFMFFQKQMQAKKNYENVTGNPQFSTAREIGQELSHSFLNNEYDEVYLNYNQFFSPLSQKAIFEKILPIDPQALACEDSQRVSDYIFEPNKNELLRLLIPHFLYFKVYFALLENSAGEHGARMTAMDNATKNALELIDSYTLLRNRARQSQITTELIEIVSGVEALN